MAFTLPSRRLVSQEDQSLVERADVPRSRFAGRYTRKTTFDPGYLVPIFCKEVLPGDHWRIRMQAFMRTATPLFPVYDTQRLDTHWFFVPHRLVWTNWVRMMGEQDNPADTINYTVPVVLSGPGGWPIGSVYDHMNCGPTIGQVTAGQQIEANALFLRSYYLIWNQWYRDQNSMNSLAFPTGNSGDPTYVLQRRMKAHDYFTTVLPAPQKFAAPAALGTQAPVVGLGVPSPAANVAGGGLVGTVAPSQPGGVFAPAFMSAAGLVASATAAGNTPLAVYADLSAISVNTLRLSFMTQALLERDARGGTRYVELNWSHFGVRSPDMRVQRPEYIGGGSTPLVYTPIAQTATGGSGVGALGAAGTGSDGLHSATYAATEHGCIIGLASVRTELSYFQGIHRQESRRTRYDYYFPALAQLGEQAVLRQEIYASGVDADDALVFGYQERWHEYRTFLSEVVGLFRGTAAGNVDEEHLAEQFGSAPVLGATFLQETPPMTRILAAASTNMQLRGLLQFDLDVVRPLPAYGTPALLGRF